MYQDDHKQTSSPEPDNSLADSDINDEVNIEELYVSRSSGYEETSSSNPESVSEDE